MRTLLSVFVLRANQLVSVSSLIEATSDNGHSLSSATIHSYVCRIRARLAMVGPDGVRRITTDEGGYRFRVEPGESDVEVFRERLTRGRAAASSGRLSEAADELRSALALWRGAALADITGRLARHEATGLHDERMAALEECTEIDLSLSRFPQVVPQLRSALLEDPLRERLAGLLMRALYACGRQAEALEVFRTTRAALVEQLAIDPSPELQILHRQILNHDVRPTARDEPVAVQATTTTDPGFIGRAKEVRLLCDLLSPGAHGSGGVAAINGLAGVGKTALAVHVATLLADRYPDGYLFVELGTHKPGGQPKDPGSALTELLEALGVAPEQIPVPIEQRSAMWRTELSKRRALVVVDDAVSTTQIQPLLPGTTDSVLVITSRHRMVGLRATRTLSLAAMPTGDATALFAMLVGNDRTAEEPAAFREVVEACTGNPLALSLAAARLRHRSSWSVQDLGRMLHDEPAVVALDVEGRSLQKSLATSYRMLDCAQQTALLALTVHEDLTFDVSAAAASMGLPSARAIVLLESLVDANMLEEVAFEEYRMNRLVRAYIGYGIAAGRSAELTAAKKRLCDYFLYTTRDIYSVVYGECPVQLGPVPAHVVPQFFVDEEHALRWWATGRRRVAASTTGLSPRDMDAVPPRQSWSPGFKVHSVVGRMVTEEPEKARDALLLSTLGVFCEWRGMYSEAAELHTLSHKMYLDCGDRAGAAAELRAIGKAQLLLGDAAEAANTAERALMISRDLDISWGAGASLVLLSDAHSELGFHQEARARMREAVDIFSAIGDEWALNTARIRRTRLALVS